MKAFDMEPTRKIEHNKRPKSFVRVRHSSSRKKPAKVKNQYRIIKEVF